MKIELEPMGFAHNNEQKHFGSWSQVVTNLILDEKYAESLAGLEDYSHVVVVYWMHEIKTRELRHVP